MQDIKLHDCFLYQKHLPLKGSPEFDRMVEIEIDRCMGGIRIDGVEFSGWLYWHLNHWWIRDDVEDDYGNIQRRQMRASLRDNEWIVAEYLEQCRVQKKGYLHIGVRQFGKSEIMASYLAYHATLFQYTQNVIVGGNDDDLQLLRDKIDFGIRHLWDGLRIPKLDKDTRKNMTRLGFKSKGGDDNVWSYLIVRNVADGNKTEGPAGVTAKAYATDEIGKFAFAQSFEAAKPAFKSKFGWRCVPILFGTGGSFDKGADAERFFFNPEANNFLSVTDPESGKQTAIFMSGLYRIDCKEATSLGEYLRKEGKVDWETPELDQWDMMASNKERARELTLEERRQKAKDPDQTEYLKLIMYYPLTPEECFLSAAANIYNVTAAKHQQRVIVEKEWYGTPVILNHDGEKIVHEFTDKRPISSFPTKPTEDKDAPAVIWEFPIENPPFGLYVAGVDPYRQGKAEYSDSLGAVYIYKRMHDLAGEKYQDMFVASYVARPDEQDTWNEQARLLIKYYNARALCENDEMSFINYMIYAGDEMYLERQPQWLKTIVPTSSVSRDYGIHRSNETIRNYLNSVVKNYLNRKVYIERDEKGNLVKEHLGYTQIFDMMFLEEIAKFNADGNFDRQIAASLALALAKHLDPQIGKVSDNKIDPRLKAVYERRPGSRIFTPSSKGLFGPGRKRSVL